MDILSVSLKVDLSVYLLFAILGSILIRAILSFLRAVEEKGENKTDIALSEYWIISFRGYGAINGNSNDYWQTFILGVLELSIFPLLLIGNKPEYLAGWLILKTLPQWSNWHDKRWVYNRFLIGNSIIIVASYFIARWASA